MKKQLSITDQVRKRFNHDNVRVFGSVIQVYFLRDRGREWIPFGGGPLYGKSAIEHTAWLTRHIAEYRDLLPKQVRKYPIKYGELAGNGTFYALQLPVVVSSQLEEWQTD